MTELPETPNRRHRVADVQLRGPAPRGRARVHWPAGTAGRGLVVLFTGGPAGAELVDRLLDDVGAVVLTVPATFAAEAHATLAWAADHAAELGAEPGRLAIVGAGSGAALAERVAELATDEGWPPLRHVALIWPHDDPAPALARLALALDDAAAEPTR
jgi:acetyl esterase